MYAKGVGVGGGGGGGGGGSPPPPPKMSPLNISPRYFSPKIFSEAARGCLRGGGIGERGRRPTPFLPRSSQKLPGCAGGWPGGGRGEREGGSSSPSAPKKFPQRFFAPKIHLVPILTGFMALLFANVEQLFFHSWKYFGVWYAALFCCTDRSVLRGLGAAFSRS
jgi:hypothetical protein